jgi:hypothetical protein
MEKGKNLRNFFSFQKLQRLLAIASPMRVYYSIYKCAGLKGCNSYYIAMQSGSLKALFLPLSVWGIKDTENRKFRSH